jgi:hypothetical protein
MHKPKKKIKILLITPSPGFFISPNHFVSGGARHVEVDEGTTVGDFFKMRKEGKCVPLLEQ